MVDQRNEDSERVQGGKSRWGEKTKLNYVDEGTGTPLANNTSWEHDCSLWSRELYLLV